MASQHDLVMQKGLPANLEAERYVLGAILLDSSSFLNVGNSLRPADFSLQAHQLIFTRMSELYERNEKIDRVTVANELMRFNELDGVGGISYLVSLDDGLPQLYNLESYVKIVKDKAVLRHIIFTSQGLIDRCVNGSDDPNEILASAEEQLLSLGEAQAADSLRTPREVIESFEGGLNAFLDPTRRIRGTSTGYTKLDEMTGGFRPGELIILAARPAMGKTALALNLGTYVATNPAAPKAVAVFSLEMSNESLLTRMICAQARVSQTKFREGYLNADERRLLQKATIDLARAPIYIDDSSNVTLMDMHAKLRRLSRDNELGLVIVDYLQLMSMPGRNENRTQEVSQLSRGLKLLSKELKCPFFVLSQLSRAPETRPGDHRPQLSDLRESGSIEQDADMVMFVFREEYYKRFDASLHGKAELILAKQRNGPTGTVKLAFLHEFTKFENLLEEMDGGGHGEG
ncbi:MAG TPA: replicative DNA helicase [Bryobacteraceae bacterium]|nr:replicative DNA helicase [Bryobacteraceae bacterium]